MRSGCWTPDSTRACHVLDKSSVIGMKCQVDGGQVGVDDPLNNPEQNAKVVPPRINAQHAYISEEESDSEDDRECVVVKNESARGQCHHALSYYSRLNPVKTENTSTSSEICVSSATPTRPMTPANDYLDSSVVTTSDEPHVKLERNDPSLRVCSRETSLRNRPNRRTCLKTEQQVKSILKMTQHVPSGKSITWVCDSYSQGYDHHQPSYNAREERRQGRKLSNQLGGADETTPIVRASVAATRNSNKKNSQDSPMESPSNPADLRKPPGSPTSDSRTST